MFAGGNNEKLLIISQESAELDIPPVNERKKQKIVKVSGIDR